MADEEQEPKEQHWLLRLVIFGVLFLDLLFVILLQGFNLELGLAGMLFALILLVLKEKKLLRKKFEKMKVLRIIAAGDNGDQTGLLSPDKIDYTGVDGRPNMSLIDIDENYFVALYNDLVGRPVGILARNFIDEEHPEFLVAVLTSEIQNLGPADIINVAERYVYGTGEARNKSMLKKHYGVTTDEELAEKIAGKSFGKKKK